jgi:hypothetical protein
MQKAYTALRHLNFGQFYYILAASFMAILREMTRIHDRGERWRKRCETGEEETRVRIVTTHADTLLGQVRGTTHFRNNFIAVHYFQLRFPDIAMLRLRAGLAEIIPPHFEAIFALRSHEKCLQMLIRELQRDCH